MREDLEPNEEAAKVAYRYFIERERIRFEGQKLEWPDWEQETDYVHSWWIELFTLAHRAYHNAYDEKLGILGCPPANLSTPSTWSPDKRDLEDWS